MAMSKPENAKSSCFSVFFHLFSCNESGNTPQLHPLDHIITKSHETEIIHQKNKVPLLANNLAKPGVVARLMGLDSMPNTILVQKGTTPDSVIPRSRSVNFLDYMLKFDISQTNYQDQVKKATSASFREVPKLFEQKKNELYWDSGSREIIMGFGESRQRNNRGNKNSNKEIEKQRNQRKKKSKKISKLKNEPRIMVPSKNSSKIQRNKDANKVLASDSACSSKNCSYRKRCCGGSRSSSALQNKQKKVLSEPKQRENVRKQESSKKIETISENLSPVSVLDVNDYSYLYGPDFLDYTSPLMAISNWESSEKFFLGDSVEDMAIKDKVDDTYHDIERVKEYFSELEVKLRTLTENDIRESNSTQIEGFEEVCLEYEHTIFDILLNEVVKELYCSAFSHVDL